MQIENLVAVDIGGGSPMGRRVEMYLCIHLIFTDHVASAAWPDLQHILQHRLRILAI